MLAAVSARRLPVDAQADGCFSLPFRFICRPRSPLVLPTTLGHFCALTARVRDWSLRYKLARAKLTTFTHAASAESRPS